MPEADTPPAAVRRRRRWWVRLLRWAFGLGFILVLLLAAGAWWVWKHPTEAAKLVLKRVPLPVQADVESLRFENGVISLEAVKLTDPKTGKQAVTVASVTWTPDMNRLTSGKLGTVVVKGLTIEADASVMDQVQRAMAGPASSGSSAGVSADGITIEDARVHIAATDSTPEISFLLDHTSSGIDSSTASVQKFSVNLRDVEVAGAKLPQAVGEGSLVNGVLKLDHVVLAKGTLSPNSNLVRFLNSMPSAAPAAAAQPAMFKRVELGSVKLLDFALQEREKDAALPDWWPPMRGRATLTVDGMNYDETGHMTMGPLQIELSEFELSSPAGEGRIVVDHADLTVDRLDEKGIVHVQSAHFLKPRIEWAQWLEDYLMGKPTAPAPVNAPPAPVSNQLIHGVRMESVVIADADLSLQHTTRYPFAAHAVLDLEVQSLLADIKGLSSGSEQRLTLRDFTIAEHAVKSEQPRAAFLTCKTGVLAVIPDAWTKTRTVQQLSFESPVLHASPDTVTWFDKQPAPATPTATAGTQSQETPMWKELNFHQLALTNGRIESSFDAGQPVFLNTNLTIATDDATDTAPKLHRLRLEKIQGSLPKASQLPIGSVDVLELGVELPGVWDSKRLNSLSMSGGEFEVGEALLSLMQPTTTAETPTTAPTAASPAEDPLKGWKVGKLDFDDTSATLQQIAPGLPPLKFAIGYHGTDMPLAPAELAGNLEEQQIEFSRLSIHSPYNPLRTVADLDTIFINFTLDGLLKQRIDKVQIIGPTLYVGEDLFWYVDYCRKYAAGEALPGTTSAAKPAPLAAPVDPEAKPAAWAVDTLKVDAGKLIIAPKGQPLPGIPRPFPFSFESKLENGKIDASFEIPDDDYEWHDPPVRLEGMNGHVLFQVPIKGVDNNLTEVFHVDRIRWKELHLENADLSVTYDVAGIYGKFNGSAYDGYINGQFDVYMDQNYSWDGWISGKDVKSTEITQKLCPAYFLLDGKVDAVVVAQGNQSEVYQCDLKFNNTAPGKFNITALNDMIKSLPTDLAGYQQDAMRIGMETFRDFEYDKVDAKARFYGREGKAKLVITGPTGSRNFDINLFDHRLKVDKPAEPGIQVTQP